MKYHQSHRSNRKLFYQLASFALITVALGLITYFGILGWFQAFSVGISGSAEDWSLLEGFVGAISLALLVGGLTYTVLDRIRAEYAEEREKNKLSYEIYRAIFEKLTDPEEEAARRWILANIEVKKQDEDIESWYQRMHARIMLGQDGDPGEPPEGQKFVKRTLNCLDYIGFIANHYWEIGGNSLDWFSPPIAKMWRRLGPYVKDVRILRKAKDYYVPAEYIGELCIQWRRDKGYADEEYVEKTP
jgi:hypothetical protein